MPRGFTFAFPPGTVLTEQVPSGYRALRRTRDVGAAGDLSELGTMVLGWAVQRRSGIAVRRPDGRDAPAAVEGFEGRVVIPLLVVGAVRWEISAPMRVTAVLNGPDGIGFAYGTLPGHPERGEEAFVVRRVGDRSVFELRALSRPAFPYSLLAPVGRLLQERYTRRYLRVLAR